MPLSGACRLMVQDADGTAYNGTGWGPTIDQIAGVLPPAPPPSSLPWDSVTDKPAFGTASLAASSDFATAAQGAKADTALQNAAVFATAAQGVKADSAVQPAGLTKAAVGLGNCDNTADAAKPVSSAMQTALDAKAALISPSFTTPNIGVASGTSLAVTGALRSSGTAGVGYAAGAGGTVTQQTNKTTGVTINKTCGQITMNGAALAAAAEVTFTVTNSTVAATDVPVVCVQSVGTAGAYLVSVGAVANGSFSITVGNASAGSLSQAVVLNFVVLKGVAA